jgi:serine/threonine protein phosphatase PrpC
MYRVGAATDIGRKRSQNQDSIASCPELGLFVVADGMGGHRGGETASAMAVEIIPQVVRESLSKRGSDWNPKEVVSEAILEANQRIFDRAQQQPQLQGMGTTAVSILFKNRKLTIGHVGDSRAYFFRDGSLWQLTRDHSLVQEKLRAGMITRAEVKTDRMKNVITRSVGFEPDVSVETYEMETQPGDLLLLCSDGLSGLVDDDQIAEILRESHKNGRQDPDVLEETVKTLINAANSNGGDDNISTILVEIPKA